MDTPADIPPDAPADKRRWKDLTLKGAGYGLVAGDIAFAIYSLNPGGVAQKPSGKVRDYNAFATSLLYSVGGAIAAKYGNPKLEKQLELLEAQLAEHLKKNHVVIPKGSALDRASLAQSGALKHLEQFFYTYPSEILNAGLGLGGAFAARSGWNSKDPFMKAYGWIVMAAALSGILIREIPKDSEKPKGAMQKAIHWCREKPLRISGMLYLINNFTLARSGWEGRKMNPGNKNYMWKLATAGCYAGANTLMALSSKQQQGSDAAQAAIVQEIGKAGAEIVKALPKEAQDKVIGEIADFISEKRLVKDDADTFAASIRNYIDGVAQTTAATHWQDRTQAKPTAAPSLSV